MLGLQTHNFNIKVYARKALGSKFRTRELTGEYAGVRIVPDEQDDLYNFTDVNSQLKRPNGVPWRGCREKDPSFIQCFVESLTDEGGIVMDWSASTGFVSNPSSIFFFFGSSNEYLFLCQPLCLTCWDWVHRCFGHCLCALKPPPHCPRTWQRNLWCTSFSLRVFSACHRRKCRVHVRLRLRQSDC